MGFAKRVSRFMSSNRKTKFLFIEAYIYLGWARFLVSLPFSWIAPYLGEQMRETPFCLERAHTISIKHVHNAIRVMSRHTLWESACLVRAIAALKMLQRRKIESTLYLGTAKDENARLIAHAWLRSGPIYITGAEEMEKFAVAGKISPMIKNNPLLYFFRRLRSFSGKKLYVNLLGMVIVSFLQGMELFLLIPLLTVSGIIGDNTGTNHILGIFKQYFPMLMDLSVILGIYLVLVVGQSLLQRSINRRNAKMNQSFGIYLIQETYRSVLQSNWGFFIKKRKSDIITTLTTEIGRISAGLSLFLQSLSSLIFTLIQVVIAAWLSVKLTAFAVICGFLLIVLKKKFVQRSKVLGNLTSELARSYLACITDQLNGIKEIKSNSLEKSRLKWLGALTDEMIQEQNQYIYLRTNSELLSKVASAVLITCGIFLSVKVLHAQPEQLLLIVLIFMRLWPRFAGLQTNMEKIASYIPAFQSLAELETECKEARELKDGDQHFNPVKSIRMEQGIECRQVYFRYNQNENIYALRDINLQISAKRMTAIVGRSGAGKSTLIDILMGLAQPEKGQVLIDGIPLTADNVLSLRKSISYVPQDPFLFNTSIKENLLLFEHEATDQEIWEALAFSACAEFVGRLPNGLDTIIGDRGVKLSGGERQRLVLARAILRKPAILVLDEATSALDMENETKIQEALTSLKGVMTIIVVAHQRSTIRNADQVIVLDEGRVVQKGGFRGIKLRRKAGD